MAEKRTNITEVSRAEMSIRRTGKNARLALEIRLRMEQTPSNKALKIDCVNVTEATYLTKSLRHHLPECDIVMRENVVYVAKKRDE